MKTSVIAIISILFLNNLSGQRRGGYSSNSGHEGFQFSFNIGGGLGNTVAQTKDFGNLVFRGSRQMFQFQLGYAHNNWASGISFGSNSQMLSSVEVKDTAFRINKNWTIDGGLFGLYIKRYIMPANVFVGADLGFGSISFVDENYETQGTTDIGFSWRLAVGKEFAIGKKKRWGLGGYASLSGINCKDVPPYDNDKYSFISPGLGFVISLH